MEYNDVIIKRRSIREFTSQPVSAGQTKALVEAALRAPSINNSRLWKFYAVTDKHLMNKMADAVKNSLGELLKGKQDQDKYKTVEHFSTFFVNAPLLIGITLKPYKAIIDDLFEDDPEKINELRRFPDYQSLGAAVQNILLKAVDLNLGACWLTSMLIGRNELEKMLNISAPEKLSAFIAVGHPAKQIPPRPETPADDFIVLMK